MKIKLKEYKSDILWKNYQRLTLIIDRVTPFGLVGQNSKSKYLNKIAWKVIEKYIDELQKEFLNE